jgi:hypothetical protein
MTGAPTLGARVLAVGVLGPGLPDWSVTAAVLRGERHYEPARTMLPLPDALPPAERRRAGRVVRLALTIAAEAMRDSSIDARTLLSVFSSSGGDGDNFHEICQTLAGPDPLLSPTRFHNSVHNAAAGYWSIAHGCMRASTSLCAYDASFGAGLLEAMVQLATQRGPLLLVTYDLDYPPPLRATRPIPDAFGIALLLQADDNRAHGPRVQLRLTQQPATCLADASLEALRGAIPAARGLPLLQQLALGSSGTVVLDYLDNQQLALEVRA